uniref:Ovule protein n=1 Tax=Heterorhabditis bacteriophora TaxID=37862 RepID=A0A1I7W7L0_HETBA
MQKLHLHLHTAPIADNHLALISKAKSHTFLHQSVVPPDTFVPCLFLQLHLLINNLGHSCADEANQLLAKGLQKTWNPTSRLSLIPHLGFYLFLENFNRILA